jgi:hypothetical protein
VWLTTSANVSSNLNLGTNDDSLRLIIFRCYEAVTGFTSALTTVADCNTAPGGSDSLFLLPVYPAASGSPCTGTVAATALDPTGNARQTLQLASDTAFGTGVLATSLTATDRKLLVTTSGGTSECIGDDIVIGTAYPIGGPDSLGAPGISATGTVQTQGLTPKAAGQGVRTDYLAAVAYLPTAADNSLQGLSSTIYFTWKAEQRRGITS